MVRVPVFSERDLEPAFSPCLSNGDVVQLAPRRSESAPTVYPDIGLPSVEVERIADGEELHFKARLTEDGRELLVPVSMGKLARCVQAAHRILSMDLGSEMPQMGMTIRLFPLAESGTEEVHDDPDNVLLPGIRGTWFYLQERGEHDPHGILNPGQYDPDTQWEAPADMLVQNPRFAAHRTPPITAEDVIKGKKAGQAFRTLIMFGGEHSNEQLIMSTPGAVYQSIVRGPIATDEGRRHEVYVQRGILQN